MDVLIHPALCHLRMVWCVCVCVCHQQERTGEVEQGIPRTVHGISQTLYYIYILYIICIIYVYIHTHFITHPNKDNPNKDTAIPDPRLS